MSYVAQASKCFGLNNIDTVILDPGTGCISHALLVPLASLTVLLDVPIGATVD